MADNTEILVKRAAEGFHSQAIAVDGLTPDQSKAMYKLAREFTQKRQEKKARLRESLKAEYAKSGS